MEKKISSSRLKVLTLAVLIILVTAFSVLIDFINAQFSTSIFTDASYWLNTLSVQVSVIVLIFVSRSLAKEKERGANPVYKTLQEAIQNAYVTINADNLNGAFKEYIAADNHARKLKSYLIKLNAKAVGYKDKIKRLELKKGRCDVRAGAHGKVARGPLYALICAGIRRAESKLAFWEGKIERAPEEVDFVRHVRYAKYSYSIIFNDAKERANEEDDPSVHEGRDIAAILFTKALGIFAFGIIATSYIVFDLAFSWDMVLKALVKLLQIVFGLYTGGVAGQDFIRHKMCAKLTIRANYVKKFMEKRKSTSKNGVLSADVGKVSNNVAAL